MSQHWKAPLAAFRFPDNKSFEDAKGIECVDQLALPHDETWFLVNSIPGAYDAIKTMKVRGAPAIASVAAMAIAAELLQAKEGQKTTHFGPEIIADPRLLQEKLLDATQYLLSSRPTAVNLREGLRQIDRAAATSSDHGSNKEYIDHVISVAKSIWLNDLDRNKTIGDLGADWISQELDLGSSDKINVLTVCNTGSLATSGYGTAFGIITSLHLSGRLNHVYFAQTGPYQQGARLTALELQKNNIPSTMVCDTAIGALLTTHDIHLFVAGADRITENGDTANKVSTYQIAQLCHHPHPFASDVKTRVVIAAPIATIDFDSKTGRDIIIEERPAIEALTTKGRLLNGSKEDSSKKDVATVLVAPEGTNAWNPAFDVTPASLIDAIVTDKGVAEKTSSRDSFALSKRFPQN